MKSRGLGVWCQLAIGLVLFAGLGVRLSRASERPRTLIYIGTQKQLFIDRYLIESLTDARQVLNPAVKHADNPILKADRPWEGHHTSLSYIVFDEQLGLFRMWYSTTSNHSAGPGGKLTTFSWNENGASRSIVEAAFDYTVTAGDGDSFLCYAVSKDGIHWEKPNLGLVEFKGSKDNNILPKGSRAPSFLDVHETDPSKRYKSIGSYPPGAPQAAGMSLNLYYSADGFRWRPYGKNPVFQSSSFGRWGPTAHMGWDPIRKVYAVYMENCFHRRCPLGLRIIGRAESSDLTQWSDAQTMLVPDKDDYPDTEFYKMPVTVYEGIYLGLPVVFRTTNSTHSPQLAFSRDGINFERSFREPFIKPGDRGDFDETTIYSFHAPIFRDGKVWIYYWGGNWRGPEMLYERGAKAIFAIGLATLPEDGFVSVDGGKLRPGKLTTRPFTFEGDALYVNVEAAKNNKGAGQPEIRVQILGHDHKPIPGFTAQESVPIRTTGKHKVTWQGNSAVGSLAGRPIQLRIDILNAKLYSFQFRHEN